jgi:hypothetical protein
LKPGSWNAVRVLCNGKPIGKDDIPIPNGNQERVKTTRYAVKGRRAKKPTLIKSPKRENDEQGN